MTLQLIIVGASITGLSLAHMIEKLSLDIEFVILEAYPEIAPQVGASIGLLPNGLRILDQLECYERIRSIAGNFYLKTVMRNSDGQLSSESRSASISERLEDRIGYPSLFIDRQMLLQVLYENLKRKDRVLLAKRVVRAEMDGDRACLHTEDGSSYEGGLVVGADGVHSIIRREICRLASSAGNNLFLPDEGSRCPPATQHTVFYEGWGYLTVHPITAQGGNGAMESAGALVNALSSKLRQNAQGLSRMDIDSIFDEVQSSRFRRAQNIVKDGERTQSIVNQRYPFSTLMIKYLVPVLGDDLFFDGWLKSSIGGLRLNGLPIPEKSKNKAFQDKLIGKRSDNKYRRYWSIAL
ncbi:hypothetical protein FSARC_14879 [Fusarium sarcochroum]|uniref:FAD-binding domain-containing protein n=1 Tax=Fusarium sarcochroum TaxID=1208366 RepID=A0A8H4SQA4_9HYPO|nr:hypothetical protein FSARC_14879 [Fusarium sarcochroum]